MNASFRLHDLLMARHVPFEYCTNGENRFTRWKGEHAQFHAIETPRHDGLELGMDDAILTPEQVIEISLGRGTCKWTPADTIEGDWWNTECGESFTWEPEGVPKCCPGCGKVVAND